MRSIVVLVCSVVLSFCSGKKDSLSKSSAGALVGAWTNYDLLVKMNSVQNSGRDSILAIDDPDQWAEVLRIKPILTVYTREGNYYSEYRDLEDTLVYRPTGIWKIIGDTLYLNQKYPTDNMSAYFFSLGEAGVTFRAVLDWDQDGQLDDVYQGTQVRAAVPPN